MRFSRALSAWLAVLLLSSTGSAWGQRVPEDEPAQRPAPELSPPPLVPVSPGDSTSRDDDGDEGKGDDQPPPTTTSGPEVTEAARPSRKAAAVEDPVPRVAVELVGGAAGGIAGGAVGLVVGYLLGAPTVGCDECQVVSLVGGLTGVVIGIPAGTWAGGRLMDGKGTLLATIGGSLVGWGGALLGSLILGANDDDKALAAILLLLPVAGATTGYELSHQSQRTVTPPPQARHDSGVRLLPVAGMTEHGPRLGLMGRF
ncbi:GlsB/YeaQ/YmgE family stress response membrane protein [Myxococcus qinghaiensis]|uniref:GlsB/YeaQ/YmgE family stress response membrane protein n=1 Tax=Myxococcus qinghaiensis TaxID=2906758 RepID=UPI0020A75D65|nr:GlsB/YeaQ/YmgE family stress response membrane protein [Myxococcus qinghaiensis]MCP3164671.1 GlsB/YeaQ/YmgE family stress response membrane protein [Myxococcus qinghaiensis]